MYLVEQWCAEVCGRKLQVQQQVPQRRAQLLCLLHNMYCERIRDIEAQLQQLERSLSALMIRSGSGVTVPLGSSGQHSVGALEWVLVTRAKFQTQYTGSPPVRCRSRRATGPPAAAAA